MNETAKKVVLVVVIVAAGVFAVVGGMRLFAGDRPEVVRTLPAVPPEQSMKRREMEAQKQGTAVGDSVVNGAPVRGERDLGDLPGKG